MEDIVNIISNLGFPIACCVVLFYQNSKLSETINELKVTLTENTTILKTLLDKEE